LWNPCSQNLYDYVQNNPLRFADPSGHAPVPTDNDDIPAFGTSRFGTEVHKIVQQKFQEYWGTKGFKTGVNVYVPKYDNPSFWGYADMVLYLGDIKEVYELKPITYKPGNPANPLGKAQLQSYIDGFNSQEPNSAVAGTTWNPNGWVIDDPFDKNKEIVLYTYASDPGMIYYSEPRKKKRAQEEEVKETVPETGPVTLPEGEGDTISVFDPKAMQDEIFGRGGKGAAPRGVPRIGFPEGGIVLP
jgi:hypothetical protein